MNVTLATRAEIRTVIISRMNMREPPHANVAVGVTSALVFPLLPLFAPFFPPRRELYAPACKEGPC